MKNFGKIISVTLVVASLVVIGIVAYHSMYGRSQAKGELKSYTVPGLNDQKGKPGKSIMDSAQPNAAANATPAPLTDDNLLQELQKTVDDGGASELEQLRQEAAGL